MHFFLVCVIIHGTGFAMERRRGRITVVAFSAARKKTPTAAPTVSAVPVAIGVSTQKTRIQRTSAINARFSSKLSIRTMMGCVQFFFQFACFASSVHLLLKLIMYILKPILYANDMGII